MATNSRHSCALGCAPLRAAVLTMASTAALARPDSTAVARTLGRIGTPQSAAALRGALATAPDARRPTVADGCLGCAEALVARGSRKEAAAMYREVGKADLPSHFRVAAAQRAILVRQPTATP